MSHSDLHRAKERLLQEVRSYDSCLVALSGGVDSAVVAQAAREALGEKSLAVTAVSPSLAEGELEQAKSVARLIGIQHRVVETREFDNAAYLRNGPNRCFHCKTELYGQLIELARQLDFRVIASGTNADDLGDYRPGLKAAADHDVRQPLADCELGKQAVRALARDWQLPVADKPAMPCLSSRIAYGQAVTPERLQMIDSGEHYLREHGFTDVRVRYHQGDVARIEVAAHQVEELTRPAVRQPLVDHLLSLGFRYVTIDLAGFRSGSLNELIQIDSLRSK